MANFHAERIIYGKLAGVDQEHTVVGQSVLWPRDCGVPKCVGIPVDSHFQGACSLDWHQSATKLMLALSWCELAPRITSRDFFQVHHLLARPEEMACVLPFLPEIVAQLRNIPVFYETNTALAPLVFDSPAVSVIRADGEEWVNRHWKSLSAVLSALLEAKSVFIQSRVDVEEKIKIVAALMLVLPIHLRSHLTFSTDEYARWPYWRRVTFSYRNRADAIVVWGDHAANDHCSSAIHPLVTKLGRILRTEGLNDLLSETYRPEYDHLSFDVPHSANQVLTLRFPSA